MVSIVSEAYTYVDGGSHTLARGCPTYHSRSVGLESCVAGLLPQYHYRRIVITQSNSAMAWHRFFAFLFLSHAIITWYRHRLATLPLHGIDIDLQLYHCMILVCSEVFFARLQAEMLNISRPADGNIAGHWRHSGLGTASLVMDTAEMYRFFILLLLMCNFTS